MKIAIIDDMRCDRQYLSDFLLRYAKEHNTTMRLSAFESGEDFLDSFIPASYDIIFMDIYLKELDGIETAQRIRVMDADTLLIFVTSTPAYAVKSFRVRAFDYLLKPYTYEELGEIMQLCNHTLGHKSQFIEVKESRAHVKILLKEIIYTDYFNHYIHIHTKARVIRAYMSFQEFSPLLLAYPQFLCCYRNCIINMNYVSIMEDCDFLLQNGDRLPIHKLRRNEIRQAYADYIFAKPDESI